MFETQLTKADDTKETVIVYSANEYVLPKMQFEKRGKGRKANSADYYNAIITLDTETSKITHYETLADGTSIEMLDGCWLYQWAMCFNGDLVAGRTVDDLVTFLRRCYDFYKLDNKTRLVVWVHNLAYDSTYMLNALYQVFDEDIKIFATGQRRPIRITFGKGLELRCSYKLVNKSLADWCEDVQPAHKKLVGEIDYSTIRTPYSHLTQSDWDYMLNDVVCQWECLRETLRKEKLRTVPMTSTGFVRRDMRNASYSDPAWKSKFRDSLPCAEMYQMLHNAFVGGYTHCNSFRARNMARCKELRCGFHVPCSFSRRTVSVRKMDLPRDSQDRSTRGRM